MRAIKIALVLVFMASSVHAEPAVYPGLIPDYQKLEPSGAYVFNATDGQWHANSSTYPLYCSVPSGGSGGTVDLTKINGVTPSAANALPAQLSDGSSAYTAAKETTQVAQGTGNYCTTVPLGVAFDPGSSQTDATATLSGICSGGTCKRLLVQNVSANPCMIQYNSSTGTAGVCVYGGTTTAPYEVDSSRWISPTTGVTNLYATTTGTTSCPTGVTVGACNLHLVGCI